MGTIFFLPLWERKSPMDEKLRTLVILDAKTLKDTELTNSESTDRGSMDRNILIWYWHCDTAN